MSRARVAHAHAHGQKYIDLMTLNAVAYNGLNMSINSNWLVMVHFLSELCVA